MKTIPHTKLSIPVLLASGLLSISAHAADIYADFPVTLKDFSGDQSDSTAYSGQIARHLLHTSLKSLAGKGNGSENDALKTRMMRYYAGNDADRAILAPVTKEGFPIKQANIDEISKDKNLKDKTFKGGVPGWPGNMTGPELIEFWIDKAASTNKGFDPLTGYNYPQLISKFLMGAVFYNQAVDNYLDEKLAADNKPNNKPYKDGAHYTGKEHSWDEAFGYFGAPAHSMTLDGAGAYSIAKAAAETFTIADYDKDGVVDLYDEMTYGHAYYAADADKSGKTNYLHTITRAFIDGRRLITAANGEALSDAERSKLLAHADVIRSNWEKVIAEAAFKYAGSVYKDLEKLKIIVESNGDAQKAFSAYGKHWGELKGFTLALQTSGRDLGETAVRLNRLVGFGPVLLGGSQVNGIGADGRYTFAETASIGNYMVHMIKVQQLLADRFDLVARKNDVTRQMADLVESLGEKLAVEND